MFEMQTDGVIEPSVSFIYSLCTYESSIRFDGYENICDSRQCRNFSTFQSPVAGSEAQRPIRMIGSNRSVLTFPLFNPPLLFLIGNVNYTRRL